MKLLKTLIKTTRKDEAKTIIVNKELKVKPVVENIKNDSQIDESKWQV